VGPSKRHPSRCALPQPSAPTAREAKLPSSIIAVVIALALAACTTALDPPADPVDPIVQGLRANPLVLTRHGECRMGCRHIDRSEVEHVLAHGAIDPARTRTDGACPSYAMEGTTPDGQQARVILAGCDDETRVVTVIDLDTDWDCVCD